MLWPLHKLKTALNRLYRIEHEIDNGVHTFRSHGMKWFPFLSHANSFLWLKQGQSLYNRYTKKYGRPDLIHVHSMLNAGVLARFIQRRHGIPYVVTEHSSSFARGMLRPPQLCTAESIARSAAQRMAVSLSLCRLLHEKLGDAAGSWIEMPNMVEQRFVNFSLPQKDKTGNLFRFISVALLTENKCVHDLIRAFAKKFPHDSTVTLDIGGDGEERSRLESIAKDLGVANRIRFLGVLNRDQVVKAMASADAFVLASRYETFGVVVIEALALGKPVIATRCGGPDSILREQDGILVPPNDVAALANAMHKIRLRYDHYQPSEIRSGCIARYSEEALVRRLTGIYSEVLQANRKG